MRFTTLIAMMSLLIFFVAVAIAEAGAVWWIGIQRIVDDLSHLASH